MVPPGQVAAIVTSLDMASPPRRSPLPPSRFRLVRWPAPRPALYRALFQRVGQRWLWFSRLAMDDATLLATIADPAVEVYAVADAQGIEIGLLELDFRIERTCELGFLGFVPELAGQGHGQWLMAQALSLAWRQGIARVWVHTCTLDHPAALGFYRKHGFRPYKQAIETFADPRLAGLLPREAAPQIPLLDPAGATS